MTFQTSQRSKTGVTLSINNLRLVLEPESELLVIKNTKVNQQKVQQLGSRTEQMTNGMGPCNP